jgi:hypothetical protein
MLEKIKVKEAEKRRPPRWSSEQRGGFLMHLNANKP